MLLSTQLFRSWRSLCQWADIKGQEAAAPEGIGLRSIASGFAALSISDEERLRRQFSIYDTLYAFLQTK
jgi:hypothetical protein